MIFALPPRPGRVTIGRFDYIQVRTKASLVGCWDIRGMIFQIMQAARGIQAGQGTYISSTATPLL
ncbi:hypothetical protein, partial [Nonomuraea sp. LPB2021202275-12-8]|uniref:hypothetical protein n=1 Tax=Nonomuraea sp. LPB2021202275-12-8 TaxID=3120159 RepID=UPI00300C55FE